MVTTPSQPALYYATLPYVKISKLMFKLQFTSSRLISLPQFCRFWLIDCCNALSLVSGVNDFRINFYERNEIEIEMCTDISLLWLSVLLTFNWSITKLMRANGFSVRNWVCFVSIRGLFRKSISEILVTRKKVWYF